MADIFIHETFRAKRARKACLACRRRKIRCNVDTQGTPCSNCLTDHIDGCRTTESLRGKRPRSGLDKGATNASKTTPITATPATDLDRPTDPEPSSTERKQVPPTHTAEWLEGGTEDFSDDARTTTLTTAVRDHSPQHSPITTQLDQRFLHQELSYANLVAKMAPIHHSPTSNLTPPQSLTMGQEPALHTCSSSATDDTNNGLPDFICPLPPTLSQVDLDYLRLKGALDIPSTDFLKALLNAFVQFVHHYAPVIDLSTIIRVLEGHRGCIGILLFQSIAFMAVSYVDLHHIQSAGFTSRRACRKAFYEKARLLYDHDIELDKLATIQAIVLLSYWADNPGDNRGCWYWIGIAISLAQILGLNRKAEYRVDSPETRLRKRVWWACYLRDRVLGLAIGRPLRIRDIDVDTPPLTLEDFEVVDFSYIFDEIELSRDAQIAFAEMCINEVELLKIGTKVLELHFSSLPGEKRSATTSQEDNGATSAMMFLKDDFSSDQLVRQYDQQLEAWYQGLPPVCVYKPLDSQGTNPPPRLLASAASLNIAFWSVVSTLHRPQLRQNNSCMSIKRVERAAIEISRINRDMHTSQLDRYLTATAAITFQHTPFITHTTRLANTKASGEVTEILDSLFFCIKVLETARARFSAADTGLAFTLCIARRSQITLFFDQDTKLWGIGYKGMHYSPGSKQLSLETRHHSGVSDPSPFAAIGQPESTFDAVPYADGLQRSPSFENGRHHDMDFDLPSFDQQDLVDWSSIADFLPASSCEYERSLGLSANFHDFVLDF